PATATVLLGGMQPFTATGTFSDNSKQDITGVSTWTSSTPAVAVVNSTGLATSASSGQTNINATFNGTTGTAVLTVN
ncbi:MAG TPA: Ig-like domain-containing protein, partial [Terriglobales bacterium]